MKKPKHKAHDWSPFAADERPVERFSPHGTYRLALAYANTYHVAMSSLAFQRVYELVHRTPEWACERFFTDGEGMPVSVETRRPIDDFGCICFSVSFEQDYVHLLQMLDRARIPLRRSDRRPWDPVIVLGGSCASIAYPTSRRRAGGARGCSRATRSPSTTGRGRSSSSSSK